VVVESDDSLDGAREELILRVDAGGLAQDLDVEAFVFEVSELFGELGG
jgi:hypothetical protein